MLVKVYRLCSEGSGKLSESFISDLLSLFFRSSCALSRTPGEMVCRHTMLLCIGYL